MASGMPSFEIGFNCKSTSVSREQSSDFHFDVRPIDSNAVTIYGLRGGWSQHLAAGDIKDSSMPGTSDFGAFDLSFTKRPAHVCARVVDGVVGACHVEDRNFDSVYLDHLCLAVGNLVSRGNFYELWHGDSGIGFNSPRAYQ